MAGNDHIPPPRPVDDPLDWLSLFRAPSPDVRVAGIAAEDLAPGAMASTGADGLVRAAGTLATVKQMAARDWAIFNAPQLTIDEDQVRREFGLKPVTPPAPRPEPVTRATRPKR